jgi:hypothetical protein
VLEITMPSKPADTHANNRRKADGHDLIRRDMVIGGGDLPASYDPKTRTAEVMISAGAAVRRRDAWSGEEWDEVLDVSSKSVRLSRLNAGAPLLDAHNYFGGMDAMLGAVIPGSARIEDGKLVANIKLSRSAKGERIAQDLADGIPINVSAGYRTHREVRNERSSPETRTAVDWEPLEVSIAPIPAEPGARIRQHEFTRASPKVEDGNIMPKRDEKTRVRNNELSAEEIKRRAAAQEAEATDDGEDDDEEEDGVDTEKKKKGGEEDTARTAATDRARNRAEPAPVNHAVELMAIGREAKMPFDLIENAVKENMAPDAFRKLVISELAKRNVEINGAQGNGAGGGGSFEVIRDENQGRAEAMEEAMLTRILASRREPAIRTAEQAEWARLRGLQDSVSRAWKVHDGHEKPKYERTRAYLGMGIVEIAAECLNYRGHIRTPAQAYDIIQRAFHSTSDFPAILKTR